MTGRARIWFLATVATLWLLGLASPATAGLDVTTRNAAPDANDAGSGRMRTQGDQLRIDMAAPPSGQGASSLVYDARADVLRIFRHDERTYVELDQEFAAQIATKMADVQKRMEAQLAKMPPDQRAMMEKMMASGAMPFPRAGAETKSARLEATPTGEHETIGGTPCTVYALTRGGQAKGDVCVASWDAIDIEASDIAVLTKLGKFQKEMTEALATAIPGTEQPFELLDSVDGFPLRTRRTENGTVVSETFFEGLTQVEVGPEAFAIPAGYTRKQIGPARDG